ncbi:hypothetical protein [Specibacter cremeus]|uniref:hypothetical protein n=1 Tax=Specibacter cremeus TaxID=1629051 RepID=UPI000F76C6D8|nr:hypothetical protein [Specibacter cremeus]
MSTNGFGRRPVAAGDTDASGEPLPWLSRARTGGFLRLPGLRHPLGAFSYGLALIALGVAALLAGLAWHAPAATAAGIVFLIVAAGLGVWLVVAAAIRWPWYRSYVRNHGHPPF